MAAISQTIFSDSFSWMTSFVYWSKLHWSLFLRVQLTMTQHWFRWWPGAKPLSEAMFTRFTDAYMLYLVEMSYISNKLLSNASVLKKPGLHYPGIISQRCSARNSHDDVIEWKQFPRYWPFVRGIHRSPVNSLHKGQWRGAFMFSLICALNKPLSKQSWGWWFETLSRPLWHHCNEFHENSILLWFINWPSDRNEFLHMTGHVIYKILQQSLHSNRIKS